MQAVAKLKQTQQQTMYRILFAIGFVHMLNDTIQAVVPATFPILEKSFNLSYLQLGLISFALNMTSSVMQPVIGWYSDKRPKPYMLPLGMTLTFFGMIGLAFSPSFIYIIFSVLFVGLGSAVFHPEGSRVAYMAAGSRRGLAQSIYQVGGNSGSAMGPVMTALIFVPFGQFGAIWFTLIAALAIFVLLYIASWYSRSLEIVSSIKKKQMSNHEDKHFITNTVIFAIILLILLVFARSWYNASISNFYALYMIKEYGISIKESQLFIFIFLAAGALGTLLGGPIADRYGKRNTIMFSMLASAPLAILLPHVSLTWAYPIFAVNGFILMSSFSVTVVYAQELLPGKIGTISGLIVGLAFGLGAIGSVVLGGLSDIYGIKSIMVACSFLPLVGILTYFLPSGHHIKE